MAKTLDLTAEEKVLLGNLLDGATIARDPLPYTDEFSDLKNKFQLQTGRKLTDSEFWIALARVGKTKKRSVEKKPRTKSPKLTTLQHLEIYRLLPEGTGSRDRLPYTPEFDEIHHRFSILTKTKFSKRDFWRALLYVAKGTRKPKTVFESAPLGNLHRETVDALEKGNPWWLGNKGKKTQSFRRWAFDAIWGILQGKAMPSVVLSGPRRVGKTVIQDQIIEQLLVIEKVEPKQILHVQFDELPWLGALKQPILSIIKWHEKNVLRMTMNEFIRQGKKIYLFFDEIQNLKSWAPELKYVIDHVSEGGLSVLATGSSSLRIKRDQFNLAGRVRQIDLGPLRLSEISGIRGLGVLPNLINNGDLKKWTEKEFWTELILLRQNNQTLLDNTFEYFSRFGGFPICHDRFSENESEYADILTDIVIKRTIENDSTLDASGHHLDRNILSPIFKLVCRYTGQQIKVKTFQEEMHKLYNINVSSKDVLESLHFLSDSMLMCQIPPLEIAKKTQSQGNKLCLCDHFLRQAWLQEVVPISPRSLVDAHETVLTLTGHLVEGIIGYYLNAISGLDMAWFPARQNEPEIDFVVTMGLKRLPIEIKYRRGKPKNGDLMGIKSFCKQKKYNAEFGLVITQEYAGPIGDNVIAIPASTFLSVL